MGTLAMWYYAVLRVVRTEDEDGVKQREHLGECCPVIGAQQVALVQSGHVSASHTRASVSRR